MRLYAATVTTATVTTLVASTLHGLRSDTAPPYRDHLSTAQLLPHEVVMPYDSCLSSVCACRPESSVVGALHPLTVLATLGPYCAWFRPLVQQHLVILVQLLALHSDCYLAAARFGSTAALFRYSSRGSEVGNAWCIVPPPCRLDGAAVAYSTLRAIDRAACLLCTHEIVQLDEARGC